VTRFTDFASAGAVRCEADKNGAKALALVMLIETWDAILTRLLNSLPRLTSEFKEVE
jgi:hypothetical protein